MPSRLFILAFLCACNVHSQTTFMATYGGTVAESFFSVRQTFDFGYILCGYTNSFGAGNSDVYLVKTDSIGTPEWSRTYGGSAMDRGVCARQLADSGYIVAGFTDTYGPASSRNVYLIRTDANGDTIWTKAIGYSISSQAMYIEPTSDGGFILCGNGMGIGPGVTAVYVVKTDNMGNVTWSHSYGGSNDEWGENIEQTSDGGYIIGATCSSFGSTVDFLLIKINSTGIVTWSKRYGGGLTEDAYHAIQTSDGGYMICGMSQSFAVGINDIYLIKTDANGNVTWSKTYGGANNDYAEYIEELPGGGYIVGGFTESNVAVQRDGFLMQINSVGDTLWTAAYGGTNTDAFSCVSRCADGGFVAVGNTSSFSTHAWFVKTDAQGRVGCYRTPMNLTVGNPTTLVNTPSLTSNTGANTESTPTIVGNATGSSMSTQCIDLTGIRENIGAGNISVYPVPFGDELHINSTADGDVFLFNALGMQVGRWKLNAGENILNTELLAPGIYLVQLKSESGIVIRKVIKN